MTDVVSFRPDAEELEAIERTRKELGLGSRAEAVRYLVRRGADRPGKERVRRFLAFRAAGATGESLSSRDIDELLYGGR